VHGLVQARREVYAATCDATRATLHGSTLDDEAARVSICLVKQRLFHVGAQSLLSIAQLRWAQLDGGAVHARHHHGLHVEKSDGQTTIHPELSPEHAAGVPRVHCPGHGRVTGNGHAPRRVPNDRHRMHNSQLN
jgi:hypothetical protein